MEKANCVIDYNRPWKFTLARFNTPERDASRRQRRETQLPAALGRAQTQPSAPTGGQGRCAALAAGPTKAAASARSERVRRRAETSEVRTTVSPRARALPPLAGRTVRGAVWGRGRGLRGRDVGLGVYLCSCISLPLFRFSISPV